MITIAALIDAERAALARDPSRPKATERQVSLAEYETLWADCMRARRFDSETGDLRAFGEPLVLHWDNGRRVVATLSPYPDGAEPSS